MGKGSGNCSYFGPQRRVTKELSGRGYGYGFGLLPYGLDIPFVIALCARSQYSYTWGETVTHALFAFCLLLMNFRIPWPKIFLFSITVTFLTHFAFSYIDPKSNFTVISEAPLEQALFIAIRRTSTVAYGFAWLFSVNVSSLTDNLSRLSNALKKDLSWFPVVAISMIPTVGRQFRESSLMARLLLTDSNSITASEAGIVTRIRMWVGRKWLRSTLTLRGMVLRLGRVIRLSAITLHSFGPAAPDRALKPFSRLDFELKCIKNEGLRLLDPVAVEIASGQLVVVSGPLDHVELALETIARIVPNLKGEVIGHYLWDHVDLWDPQNPLAVTRSLIVFINGRRATGAFGSTVYQQLSFAIEDPALVQLAAKEWSLGELLNRNFESLSGGERIRCLLAAALNSRRSKLVVLNDAFSELDDDGKNLLVECLTSIRVSDTRKTIVISNSQELNSIHPDLHLRLPSETSFAANASFPTITPAPEALPILTVEKISIPSRNLAFDLPTPINIQRGHITCLRGPNGSGKTSILDALAGSISCTPPLSLKHMSVAYLMQDPAAYFLFRTPSEQWSFNSDTLKNSSREFIQFRNELWKIIGEKSASISVETLSRFDLRLASIFDASLYADVLLIDEPDIYLGDEDRIFISDILVNIRNLGIAVICASHSQDIFTISDSMIYLGNGKK